jgi:hypothetical protein
MGGVFDPGVFSADTHKAVDGTGEAEEHRRCGKLDGGLPAPASPRGLSVAGLPAKSRAN